MTEPRIISDPNRIDAGWLTDVLAFAEIPARVTGFTAEKIGTGQVGDNVRFVLQGTGDLPVSLVGKFPSSDPVSRQTGIDTNNYRREVHFYRHIHPKVNIQTPVVLFTDVDDDTHEFVMIMEDLAPGEQGDQLGGCDAAHAELALTQLAHLHGPVWGDSSLMDNDLIVDRSAAPENLKLMYDALAPGFLSRYDARLTSNEKQMVTEVGANLVAMASGYTGKQTLVHIDYRLDNMMFGGPYPLAVVDWQSPAMDCAMNDVAYFMGTSLPAEYRAAVERDLLDTYLTTLSGYEHDMSRDDCWRYYRHYAPAGLIMAVIASMIVGVTPRGNDMFMVMAKRSANMCRELDWLDVVRG